MTSKYENFATNYFLTRAAFLGIGFSSVIALCKQDSILAFVIGAILGLFMIFFINKIQKFKGEKRLLDVLKEMKGLGVFIRILLFLFASVLICEGFTFLQLFASSFFLLKSPIYYISLPILLLLIRISKNGIRTTFRVSACMFPLSVFLTLISFAGLCVYLDLGNFSPLFITEPMKFLNGVIHYTALSVSPCMLMLITEKSKGTGSYLFGSFTLIGKMFLIIAVIGPVLASVYRYPEYVILKEIKLLNFIEKIENIVGLSWIFDIFIYLAMASVMLKEMLPKKGKKFSYVFSLILLYFISILFIGKFYTNEILVYYTLPFILLAFYIIIVPILFIYTYSKYLKNKKA